jgi:protein SCO1/2
VIGARSIVLVTVLAATAAGGAVDPGLATAPRMDFVPPAAGTYRLEHIQSIADAALLDVRGQVQHLSSVTKGKVTLLTFFYANCNDPLGCPYAYGTLHRLRATLLSRQPHAGDLRFVSVSLDPTRDTPQSLAAYAQALPQAPAIEWDVLTARSVHELVPVLDDFGQDVSIEVDARGRPLRAMHHMLKMFLIDRGGTIREIYSLAFLHPEVIANDVSTLLAEAPARARRGP